MYVTKTVLGQQPAWSARAATSARYCPAEGGSEVAGWPGKSNVRALQPDGARKVLGRDPAAQTLDVVAVQCPPALPFMWALG